MAKKKISEKIVCDTNVFINYLQKEQETVFAVEQIRNENIIMPIITAMELFKGAGNKDELKEIQDFINLYSSLQLNYKGIELALELIKKYHFSHNLGLADSLIAASVIIADLQLFTFNVKDFDFISGLKLHYPPSLSKIKRKSNK
jgi:predicted nucleic acid-binding protein